MKTHLLVLAAALVAGCAETTTPVYDTHFGEAVRQARQAMTINPQGAAPGTVAGIDGLAARETFLRYQNSFKDPPAPVNVINIGTTGGAR